MNNLIYGFPYYLSELMIAFSLIVLLIIEFFKNKNNNSLFYFIAGLGLSFSYFFSIKSLLYTQTTIFYNSLVVDGFSTVIKIILILGTIAVLFLTQSSKEIYSDLKSRSVILIMLGLLGAMILVSANNFLTFYLGIEILSVISYILVTIKFNDGKSSEAGIKFLFYGLFATGIMLFGISHLWGILGSIHFYSISHVINSFQGYQKAAMLSAFLLFFVGLGYKVACFPFHMWLPDVFEGAPTPVAAFLSTVSKIAGIGFLARVTTLFFNGSGLMQDRWLDLLQVIAALTVTVGNFSAINQKSVKRMLAYSSIAHIGMMLLGILVVSESGNRSILFYIISYFFMNIVAFFITAFISEKFGNDNFERFNGLFKRYPAMAIAMTIVMFSMAGLPPFCGFFAKFTIISAVIEKQFYTLAIIAVLNSLIALYYYIKIIRNMLFKEPEVFDEVEGFNFLNQFVVVGMCIPVVLLGIFWENILIFLVNAKIYIS